MRFILTFIINFSFLNPLLSLSPILNGITNDIVHVDGGIISIKGSEFTDAIFCIFRFKLRGPKSTTRVQAKVVNATAIDCLAPKSPYRLVLHHQHRLPWPGCPWDARCMANSFSLSLEINNKVVEPSYNLSYYMDFQQKCSNSAECDQDKINFQRELYNLNHPPDCSTAKVLLIPSPKHQAQCTGIGMVFYSHYISAMKHAYEQGRALVLADDFLHYCYMSDRIHRDEQYILPPSKCTPATINASLAVTFKADIAWFSSIKKPDHLKKYDLAWFRSNFLKYLFRYSPKFMQHLTDMEARINFQTPCIGVHLRRGERGNLGFSTVWLADYPLFDLSDVMRILRYIKRQRGVTNIFLATDEPKFFADLQQYRTEFRTMYDTAFKRAEGGRDCVREVIAGCTPGLNASSVVKTILTEMYFLSQCQHYAGTLTSTFSKLAVDYMISKQNDSVIMSLE